MRKAMRLKFFIASVILISSFTAVSETSEAIEAFDLELINGTEVGARYKSNDYPDAVFVLVAFQLHCGFCRQNAPQIEGLARFFSYEPRVQVLDLGIDSSRSNILSWVRQIKPDHPVLMDAGRRVWQELHGTSTPTIWVLDCRRNVQWVREGVLDPESQKDMTSVIDRLLQTDIQGCT